MPLTETESQTKYAKFDGALPSGADIEILLTLDTGTNNATMRLRLSGSAGLQGIADDLKVIRNRIVQKYDLNP